MSLRLSILLSACLAVAASASLPVFRDAGGGLRYAQPRSFYETHADMALPEVPRIRKHLESVEADLRAHLPPELTAAQQAARARRLDDLGTYRLAGRFPRNLDFPDAPTPYFLDAEGTACAVGQLIIASGRRDLAEAIARRWNNAYLRDIPHPELPGWAAANGLTLEECARIQPGYTHYADFGDVKDLAIEPGGRIWALTGSGMANGYKNSLSYYESGAWKFHSFFLNGGNHLCLVDGRPLLSTQFGFLWEGVADLPVRDFQIRVCAAMGRKAFWVGGIKGMHRYSVDSTGPATLAESVRGGIDAFPGDTVWGLTVDAHRVWAATPKALASRPQEGGAWTVHYSAKDSAGEFLGGLTGNSEDGVWFGLLPHNQERSKLYGYELFSLKGVLRSTGSGGKPMHYHQGNSALPTDTLWVAEADGDTAVWCKLGTGLVHFTPPHGLRYLPDVPRLGARVLRREAPGRLLMGPYVGSGNKEGTGLWRVEDSTLVHLGFYATPPLGIRHAFGSRASDFAAHRILILENRPSTGHDLQGRLLGPAASSHGPRIVPGEPASRPR